MLMERYWKGRLDLGRFHWNGMMARMFEAFNKDGN